MAKLISQSKNTVFTLEDLRAAAKAEFAESGKRYKVKDKGLESMAELMIGQWEQNDSPRGLWAHIHMTPEATYNVSNKLMKKHRRIKIKQMASQVAYAEKVTKQDIIPASEDGLGEGITYHGTVHDGSSFARVGRNYLSYFKLRGITSKFKTFHASRGFRWKGEEVVLPCLVVIDEQAEHVTWTGELFTSDRVNNTRLEILSKEQEDVPAILKSRKFRAGRIIDRAGLKGVTLPHHDLGYINWHGSKIPVDVIAGVNSIKGGMTQAKIWGWQFANWKEFNIRTDKNQLTEVLTGHWYLPDGTHKKIKFGLSYVRFTELADQFNSYHKHRMGTEIIRSIELQGNGDISDYYLKFTTPEQDTQFRQMLGELEIENSIPGLHYPTYDGSFMWNVTSQVESEEAWAQTPFPEHLSQYANRLIPSKAMVQAAAIPTSTGKFILPRWATAWASALVTLYSRMEPNWERLDGAIVAAIEDKRGTTRKGQRPFVPCLQGKQVGHKAMNPSTVGTTKMQLWDQTGLTIRYPLLWNQVQKSVIVSSPTQSGAFKIDLEMCQGLIFRNEEDMMYEQSDSDGDVSFTYTLEKGMWNQFIPTNSMNAHRGYLAYKAGEVGAVLKDMPIVMHQYKDVRADYLKASINKATIGTATMDLWKVSDLFYGSISNSDLIELIDACAFYVQNQVVRGIKHEGASSDEYDMWSFISINYPDYSEQLAWAQGEEIQNTRKRMGLAYVPRTELVSFGRTWITQWNAKVFNQKHMDLVHQILHELMSEDRSSYMEELQACE